MGRAPCAAGALFTWFSAFPSAAVPLLAGLRRAVGSLSAGLRRAVGSLSGEAGRWALAAPSGSATWGEDCLLEAAEADSLSVLPSKSDRLSPASSAPALASALRSSARVSR